MTLLTPSTIEERSARAARDELVDRIARAASGEERIEVMDGLMLRHASAPVELGPGVSFPAVCVIAQGSKETTLGENRYAYDASHYLITTTELPITSRIVEASPDRPYLGIVLRLDPSLVSSVMVEAGHLASQGKEAVSSFNVSPLDFGLLDAVVRYVRLLEAPGEASFLLPHIKREIVYRLLTSEQGDRLRHIAILGGTRHRIVEAISRIRQDFDKPMRVADIAREFGMSVSSFHAHFKAVTAMSPLEFQKQLRLQEARKLMLGDDLDATSAGLQVGYRDASQFTREYKRLFGEPPMRDIVRLRDAMLESAVM
ncbi:MAG TPA: AraC family transcriptional regulator [Thermomicrobiales bacterium]|nr:AraC family transcriptional regulator [Thermomicrobiales bacterium]